MMLQSQMTKMNVHGSDSGRGAGSGTDGGEGSRAALSEEKKVRSAHLAAGICMITYRSLDVLKRLTSGESRGRKPDVLGDGDDLGAVGERTRVLAEGRELAHELLELGHHARVVVCVGGESS